MFPGTGAYTANYKRLHPLHNFKQVHHDISLLTDGPQLTTSMFWKDLLHLSHKEAQGSVDLFVWIHKYLTKKSESETRLIPLILSSAVCFLFQIKDVGHENMKAHTPLCLRRGSIETIVSAH